MITKFYFPSAHFQQLLECAMSCQRSLKQNTQPERLSKKLSIEEKCLEVNKIKVLKDSSKPILGEKRKRN